MLTRTDDVMAVVHEVTCGEKRAVRSSIQNGLYDHCEPLVPA